MNSASLLYEVSTRLAVGGAGLIYKATERATGRAVVLKLLLSGEEVAHPLDAHSLLRDAPGISLMTGENIVALLNAFQDEDGTVLVYEFAEGTRGVDVPGTCPIPASDALDVAAQVLSALHGGEYHQYPHGDLKPSDITLGRSAEGRPLVKVLDWGLANYRREPTPAALPYTAPERLDGASPSHVADLFSAGAVLHYLFTGGQPVEAKTKEEFAAAWRRPHLHPLQRLRPDLPASLVNLIARLLQPDPAQRPASAAEALTVLTASGAAPRQFEPMRVNPAPAKTPHRSQAGQRTMIATSALPRAGHPGRVIVRMKQKSKSSALPVPSLLLLMALGIGGIYYWSTQTGTGSKPGLANTPEPSKPQPSKAESQPSPVNTAPRPAPVVAESSAPVAAPAPARVAESVKPPAPVVAADGRATFSSSAAPPAVDGSDIANLAVQTVTDKWFFESISEQGAADAAKGVTFYTGNSPVLLRAITFKMVPGCMKAATPAKPTTWTIRLGTVTRKAFKQIVSAQAEQTADTGKGDYLTWTFATPVPLPADTTFAADVAMRSRTEWTTGIPYLACSGNVPTPGVRESYHSGDNGKGGSTISRSEEIDRIFHLDLEAR